MDSDATRVDIQSYNKPLAINRAGNNVNFCEGGVSVGIGAIAFGGLRFTIGNTNDTGAATNGFNIYTNRAVCSLICNGATDAAGTTFNYSWSNGGQGPFIIANASGEAARFNSTGTFILGGGNAAANGRGVAFPATQSASTDANTLDDYEEGNWTPTIVGNTTAGTGTYTFQGGRYTKIGNRVFVEAYLSWSAHTGTGDMKIGGLPFSITSLAFYTSGCIGDVNAISITAGNTLAIVGINTSSEILFKQLPVGGGSSANVPIDTQANISFSFCYMV
jgi:hypothetical protein